MGISVAQALCVPSLKEARLVAGKDGLMRTVECIGLMEGRDSVKWVEKNSLIVNNSRALERFTPGEWVALIDELVERHAAGMALKVGRYVKEIPPSALERANVRGFPLVALPLEAGAAQIINDVCYALFRTKPVNDEASRTNALLKDIALEREDRALLRETLSDLGWKSRKPFGVVAFQDRLSTAAPHRDDVAQSAQLPDWTVTFKQACADAGFSYCFPIGGFAFAVTVLSGEPDPSECLAARAVQARELLQRRLPRSVWYAGVGRVYDSLMSLPDACWEARATLAVSLVQESPTAVIEYKDLGFLGILLDVRNRDRLARTVDEALASLRAYDEEHDSECERTLRVHARNGMSVRKTATALFLHENTVRYRLSVIDGLLASGIFKGGRQVNTDLLCYLYRWQLSMQATGDVYVASYLEE